MTVHVVVAVDTLNSTVVFVEVAASLRLANQLKKQVKTDSNIEIFVHKKRVKE